MRYAFILLLLASSAMAQNLPDISNIPEGKDPKFPIPVDAELAYPRSVVDEVFGEQIKEARTVSEKSKVASDILDLAENTKSRFEEYALIEQAHKLAISAKDLTTALRAVDLLSKTFRVDKAQLRKEVSEEIAGGSESSTKTIKQLETLDAIAKKNPSQVRAVADACYKLADKLRGPLKQAAIERAIKYYKAAMPTLSGLEKRKAEVRVKNLEKMMPENKYGDKAIRITATINGSDELRINKIAAMWKHHSNGTPQDVTINGKKWNTQKQPLLSHSPAMRKVVRSANFSAASLIIEKGRGEVYLLSLQDHVRLIFEDEAEGSGEYEVVILFE